MLKRLGIFFNSVYRIFTGKKKSMTIDDIYNKLLHSRDEYIKGFDYLLNNETERGKFKGNSLRFKKYDFEFILKTEIDPYKDKIFFKTFRILESEIKFNEFDLKLIEPLNITFNKELINGSNLLAARFDSKNKEDRCYTVGTGQVNDFVTEYKNILEDYLKLS